MLLQGDSEGGGTGGGKGLGVETVAPTSAGFEAADSAQDNGAAAFGPASVSGPGPASGPVCACSEGVGSLSEPLLCVADQVNNRIQVRVTLGALMRSEE